MAYRSVRSAPSRLLRSAACSAALALFACGDGDDDVASDAGAGLTPDADAGLTPDADAGLAPDAAAAEPISVSLEFEARVGSEPFACSTSYQKLGTSQASATFSDFRVYVYDVRLIDAAGTEVPVSLDQNGVSQYENAALLDFEDKTAGCSSRGSSETNDEITGEVPFGQYEGVAFKVGLPPALNHSDVAASSSPLDIQALSWGWAAGRTFVTIDLSTVPAGDGAGTGFPVHVGSTMCTGNPAASGTVSCARKNIAEVKLLGFDPKTSKIVLDAAALVQDVALDGPGGGCMSTPGDAECGSLFAKLGIDADTGGASASEQTVFRVVAK